MIDEIQVYTDDINVPGQAGLELHLNTTLDGRAQPDYPNEVTPHHGLRLTPEFSYGLNRDFEAGLYLPSERTADGSYLLAGAKLRLKWLPVQPAGKAGGWFLGFNGELSYLPAHFDLDRWGFELRSMIGHRTDRWLLAANPVFGWALSGPDRGGRPEAEFQFKAARTIAPGVAFGPEYYANFGPVGRALPFAEQDHALYAAFDFDLKPWVFNVGLGRGLSSGADKWTLKFIFEVSR